MAAEMASGSAAEKQQLAAENHQPAADHDLEVWKHFASMGGIDKNTMISTVSFLLGLAATAIWYIVTQLVGADWPRVEDPGKLRVVSLLALVISGLAVYLTLLYGGYANRNWAKADEIASRRGWSDLLPELDAARLGSSGGRETDAARKRGPLAAIAWRLARPCNPERTLPPVFVVFATLTLTGVASCLYFIFR